MKIYNAWQFVIFQNCMLGYNSCLKYNVFFCYSMKHTMKVRKELSNYYFISAIIIQSQIILLFILNVQKLFLRTFYSWDSWFVCYNMHEFTINIIRSAKHLLLFWCCPVSLLIWSCKIFCIWSQRKRAYEVDARYC